MRPFYSPFIDNDGKFIPISKIRFSHISQLKNRGIEEGYQIEYKSKWDDIFLKKHFCQTITSFANSEGGWLFIGIEDNTAEYIGIKKLKADFSQIISQKLNSSVSPMPRFESKFIENPKSKNDGVLIIYIYEGINPPYICNGTVYVRNGSSKIPVKPGRIEIDHLIQKRESVVKRYKEFCKNDFVKSDSKFPFCTVYLYNPHAPDMDINKLNENLKRMRQTLSESERWQRIRFSTESVVCYNSNIVSKSSITSIAEFYANGNIKLFCPLFLIQGNRHERWAEYIKEKTSIIDVDEMPVIDGYISYSSIQSALHCALEYIKKSNYHFNDYNIMFEYKNIGNVVLFFRENIQNDEDEKRYIQNLSEELYFSSKNEISTLPTYFLEDIRLEDAGSVSFQLLETDFALVFGMSPDDLNKKIVDSIPLYQEKTFTSHP